MRLVASVQAENHASKNAQLRPGRGGENSIALSVLSWWKTPSVQVVALELSFYIHLFMWSHYFWIGLYTLHKMEFLHGGEKTRNFQALWPGAVLTTVSVINKRSQNNNNKLKHLNPAVGESFYSKYSAEGLSAESPATFLKLRFGSFPSKYELLWLPFTTLLNNVFALGTSRHFLHILWTPNPKP